jgi:predicted MFS family arabinose efflux permease
MRLSGPTLTVLKLGTAQTLAWASTYYLCAILAAPMARDLGLDTATVFAALSVGLLVTGLLGPRAGKAIDTLGGRPVLALSNGVFAVGLVLLGCAQTAYGLFGAWLVIGIGMAGGLYEAAFAALVRIYGTGSRNAITGITLLAGFASTVGWPLTTALEHGLGWRGTCFVWAAVHIVIALPLNLSLPALEVPGETPTDAASEPAQAVQTPVPWRTAALLGLVFAITWFISTAMAAHLPTLLAASGVSVAMAVTAGALIGPAQVLGRLTEFSVLRQMHPLWSARLASALHPVGAMALALMGAPAAFAFALLHGGGNGVMTIAKGTLPLALFGPQGYGERQGVLMMPARLAQALAPWLFGLCMARWGAGALWLSAGLGIIASVALWLVSARTKPKLTALQNTP